MVTEKQKANLVMFKREQSQKETAQGDSRDNVQVTLKGVMESK